MHLYNVIPHGLCEGGWGRLKDYREYTLMSSLVSLSSACLLHSYLRYYLCFYFVHVVGLNMYSTLTSPLRSMMTWMCWKRWGWPLDSSQVPAVLRNCSVLKLCFLKHLKLSWQVSSKQYELLSFAEFAFSTYSTCQSNLTFYLDTTV